ncbi:MAG TPA: T9SS type A sorting domain-containing protein [Rubricoccaceae bacterium]|nr:T9SS type A sorting domain-containing protein [Rubricoccaceae bacterium]
MENAAPRAARRFVAAALRAALVLTALLAPRLAAAQVSATVDANGVLVVIGTSGHDTIAITCAGGDVKVNGQNPSTGAYPCHVLSGITVIGDTGNDTIDCSEVTSANGFALTRTPIFDGGAGSDTIIGTGFHDIIAGGSDNDTIDGRAGDDTCVWEPGEGNDFVEGGDGMNELEVTGTAANEGFHLFPGYLSGNPNRLDVVNFLPACCTGPSLNTVQSIIVHAGDGNDQLFSEGNLYRLPFTLNQVILDGQGGSNWFQLNGTPGRDLFTADWDEVNEECNLIMRNSEPPGTYIPMRVRNVGQLFAPTGTGSDRLWTQGLPGIPQGLDGGTRALSGGGDTLTVDTEGLSFTHTGNVITIQGRAPITYEGFESVVIVDRTAAEEVPEALVLTLSAAYPNPFATSAALTLAVARAQAVRVALYDALGREVAVLHEGLIPAGERAFAVDGTGLPSGVYVVRAEGEAFTAARRVVLLR